VTALESVARRYHARIVSVASRPIIVLVGPTAGGKSALAAALARAVPGGGECISADSMQVYRRMDIGTAKPPLEVRRQVPHHLIDIVDPAEDGFSVETWLSLAEDLIVEIRGRGPWPIVVGGTNLYVQALLEGLFEGPGAQPMLRRTLEAIAPEELHRRLERVDRDAAARIHRNDRRRAIRAIEVYEATGRPISAQQRQWFRPDRRRQDVVMLGLEYPAAAINQRINARVRAMLAAGLLEETRELLRGGIGRQAREALGYKQMIEHLEGRCSLEEAVEQIKIRTRRYAKQQRTWLRRFRHGPGSVWIEAADLSPETLAATALQAILGPSGMPPAAARENPATPGETHVPA
jgi:tRNA dimethylallyltransferase